MIAKKGFLDNDFRMRNLLWGEFPQALVLTAKVEKLAVKGTGYGLLAFLAAALGADVLAQGGAKPFWPPGVADGAFLGHQF